MEPRLNEVAGDRPNLFVKWRARSFALDLLKDLLTLDVFSVYLLSRVDIVIRYIEVDFTFGLPDYVRYIEDFVISRFVISRF